MTEPAWASKVKTAAALVFLVIVGILLFALVFVLLSEISVLAAQIGTWVFIAAGLVGLAFLARSLARRSRLEKFKAATSHGVAMIFIGVGALALVAAAVATLVN